MFLAALATAYLTFLLTQLGQQVLPSLLAAWQGRLLLEEVRVLPLALTAISGGFQASRPPLLDWPVVFGTALALLGWLWSRRGGMLAALSGYHLAAWNLILLATGASAALVFGRRTPLNWTVAVLGITLLLFLLGALAERAARYATSTVARLEAALFSFLAPFLILMVLFWRINLRLPVRGPQTLAVMLGAIGVLVILALAAAALARVPEAMDAFPRRDALLSSGLAALVLVCLIAYGQVPNWLSDRRLARAESAHYLVSYPAEAYASGRISALLAERERQWPAIQERLAALFGPEGTERLRVRLFPTLEAKYQRTRSTLPESVSDGEIFAVVNAERPRWTAWADAEAMLQAASPERERPRLEFLNAAAAGFLAGPDLTEAGRIVAEEGPYTLARLSGPDGFISPLVRRPLAAAFAAWIGPQQLRQLYSTGSSGNDWRLPLEDGWRQYQTRLAMSVHLPPPATQRIVFQKGVALVQEGGARSGGYGSERAVAAVQEVAGMGVDSVAVMPLGFMTAPDSLSVRMLAGEGDESIEHITWAAHQAGLRVMLKPQIWMRGGRQPGEIRFAGEDEFQTWWRAYRQWILHYARLAQRDGADLLCVGTDLQQISPRQGEWRRLIAEIRRVYHGPLTYAAHWGREFEEVAFWDALDYMGLNDYTPLSDDDGSTTPDVLRVRATQAAAQVEAVQKRWNKPVLLTEVGYPSQSSGARLPWREDASTQADPALQARLYEALLEAFYRQPWFYGMYWWKWPSSGFGGGPEDTGLTPLNKPAAQVVRAWYQGDARRVSANAR